MNKTQNSTIPPRQLWVFAALIVVLCASTSYLTVQWAQKGVHVQDPTSEPHNWLHKELSLTKEQSLALANLEQPYQEQRALLLVEFRSRINALNELLRTSKEFTPEVGHAIHRLHEVHGDLQQLSIDHYFQMLDVLPPEKQAKLRSLAVEALSEPE
jgi:Spy/CpxP family protein refolding chaperone